MDNSKLEKLQKKAALLAQRAAVYSTNVIPQNINVVQPDSEVEKEIKSECEMMAQELISIHSRLESRLETEQQRRDKDSKDMLQTVLKAKERRLRGEVAALENKDIEVVSIHPDFVDVMLKHEMSEAITQLEQTLSNIRTDRKKLADCVQRERIYLDQQKEVEGCLQAEIQNLRENWDAEGAIDSELQELEKSKQDAMRMQKKLMKSLASFVSEHYSLQHRQTDPPLKRTKVKSNTNEQHSRQESLLHLIEVLMNQLFDAPHDPYIQLTDRYWPPYVELLLRCGIAQRHHDDFHRLRLAPYHL